jgi:dATP pyrophosphohydrolase
MARAPFQILVYPYRQTAEGQFEYAIFQRAYVWWWQGIAGGGEDGETPLQAAQRESFEEAGISADSQFLRLDTIVPVRAVEFNVSQIWGEDIYVIPMYCFGVKANQDVFTLSHEHLTYRWLRYLEAHDLTRYDSNRTALWELDARLRGKGPRG